MPIDLEGPNNALARLAEAGKNCADAAAMHELANRLKKSRAASDLGDDIDALCEGYLDIRDELKRLQERLEAIRREAGVL